MSYRTLLARGVLARFFARVAMEVPRASLGVHRALLHIPSSGVKSVSSEHASAFFFVALFHARASPSRLGGFFSSLLRLKALRHGTRVRRTRLQVVPQLVEPGGFAT